VFVCSSDFIFELDRYFYFNVRDFLLFYLHPLLRRRMPKHWLVSKINEPIKHLETKLNKN
jgi:hypothetical protein